jgi:hypothetical protein
MIYGYAYFYVHAYVYAHMYVCCYWYVLTLVVAEELAETEALWPGFLFCIYIYMYVRV